MDRDIVFPELDAGPGKPEEKMWFHITDFQFDRVEGPTQPKPKPRQYPPPPMPGQPFPPPPGGFKKKENKQRRLCEQSK